MPELVDALCRADDAACYEFCRRQRRELLDALIAGAERLGSIAFELELQRPQELMAWKFPDRYEPFHALPTALDAACEGREHDVYAALSDARFAELAATNSACTYLKDAARRLKQYGYQSESPQRSLL